ATDGRAAPHEDWQAQYAFDTAAAERADLEQANHWTATRPGTRFTSLHIVSGVLPDGFAALTDRQLSMSRGGASESREIADAGDYRATLRDMFALELSEAEIARLPLFA
ncbi:MAG TPA: arylamine N-acetyltransferase, partial [Alteraurantiacibacter sp.]